MLLVLKSVRPKSLTIAAAVINAAQVMGLTKHVVVTSGNDATHMEGSKHYTGEALDFRTKHLTTQEKTQLQQLVAGRLGAGYQLLLEDEGGPNEHLHIEYDV